MYTRTPKRWFCSSNKRGRIARIMAIGAADFSFPRSLGMGSAISTASFYPSFQLYLRRNISFDQTSNDPSSSTPSYRSFTGIQSFVDKPYNMNYVVPHNVMLPNDQFVINSEDCQSTYLPPEYPRPQKSMVEDWIKETIRLELDKRRWRSLELSDDTGNSTPKIKGYDRETDSVKKSVSDPSFCPPKLDLSGGDRGTWIPQMMDSSVEISSSLKQDTLGDAQSNGLSIQNLETAECNTAYKGELKSDGLKEANVVNHRELKSDGLKEANIVNHCELKSDGLKEANVVNHRKNLFCIYEEVLVVDDILSAKKIVKLLTTKYRNLVHACDTEVAKIAVKLDTPVDHGEMICFSIYSGPEVDFGNGKSCIWVDVLDGGGRELLMEFAPFFEDPSIRKVWHNYSFDSHVIENYGIRLSGFHADTMHMARLWDSSRRTEGGYSLEALTSDSKVMNGDPTSDSHLKNVSCSPMYGELLGKISMKTIFGKKKFRRDGSVGSVTTIPPVEELQKNERNLWISYSALDSMSTLHLFESLRSKLEKMVWFTSGKSEAEGSMHDFYEAYWKPFGQLLVKMETEGVLVDRAYLAEIEKVAALEQKTAGDRFRKWAAKYCPDAIHMNVESDIQVRQLFYGGILNRKDPNEALPLKKSFKMPIINNVIEEGKTAPSKFHTITLTNLGATMESDTFTPTGWPSVSGDSLKALAGKVSAEYDWINDIHGFESDIENPLLFNDLDAYTSRKSDKEDDVSSYGRAYKAFGGNKEGKEACHAISALCEVRAIDSLISSFILPLQSNHISGKDGRVHCSLNINTETGRLSARRPNLQNQPALEKDRYKIRQAFIAAPGNSLIVADYGQLELRILAHLADCKSMKDAFKAGGDFHSRTAMNMYSHIREAVEKQEVLLEWHPQPNQEKPPVPLLKDAFASERRKAKMLNFSIAYGKTPHGLAKDWKVSLKEAKETVDLWYRDRKEVLRWQEKRKQEANKDRCVKTLLGRTRMFPSMKGASFGHRAHIERAAINTPVQGSAADVAMCGMLEIERNKRLKELGWRLLLQVHDEVILEGPTESGEEAKAIVVECLSKPFNGTNILDVDLSVDAKCAQNWYAAK